MGYAKKRTGRDGKPRYTAVYLDLRGSERSAGTFASENAANQARPRAAVELRQGRVGHPARGRQTLRQYVEERWLPNHVIEPTTREKYAYYLSAHIYPVLGPLRIADIFPEHIREWITWMQREGPPRAIITPEQFDAIYAALPDADAQLRPGYCRLGNGIRAKLGISLDEPQAWPACRRCGGSDVTRPAVRCIKAALARSFD